MIALPASPAEITTSWLTHVLDAPVTAVRVTDAHAGTTGRAVIELDYAAPVALPPRLFVKLPPADPAQQAFVRSSGMGRREALFYQHLSAEVPVRVPRAWFAASDDGGASYIMLLEHLEDSGCTFRNARRLYSPDYLRRVLGAFARLHGAYWETPRFTADLAWVDPLQQHDIAQQLVGRALSRFAGSMPAVFTALAELYLAERDAIHRLWQSGPVTLVHGDVHDGNLFFDGDEPGLLDWAVVARAPGMRDVGYFLAATLRAEDRHGLPGLLAYYREDLLAAGAPAPEADELWRQLQWHAAYVWLSATVTLAMGDAWQPVNYVSSALERLHGALEHLQSIAALREALSP